MCQACFDADAMFRDYLLRRPDEREKLTAEEADYYGFRRDAASGRWVDAWGDLRIKKGNASNIGVETTGPDDAGSAAVQ